MSGLTIIYYNNKFNYNDYQNTIRLDKLTEIGIDFKK